MDASFPWLRPRTPGSLLDIDTGCLSHWHSKRTQGNLVGYFGDLHVKPEVAVGIDGPR